MKIMRISKWALAVVAFVALVGPLIATAQQQEPATRGSAQSNVAITREVRHELIMLPWYSVFDNLAYSVNGYRVTLVGQVVRPSLRSDAEAAVMSIEGVESVDNQIEVLPPSPNDDQIRRAEFRAIYSQPSLQRYAEGAVPPIHIIVKNGHVSLEGAVSTEADKNVANIQANGVPGVFSVTNNLTVRGGK
jgi:hyperosmotically inducible protein